MGLSDSQGWYTCLTIFLNSIFVEDSAQALNSMMNKRGLSANKLLETIGVRKEDSLIAKKALYEGITKSGVGLKQEEISKTMEKILDGQDFLDKEKLSDLVEIEQGK